MIRIINKQRKIPIDQEKIKKVLEEMVAQLGYHDFDLGVLLTTDATIKKYNSEYRDKHKPTDILSFPYHDYLVPGETIIVKHDDDKNLGDIVISLEYVKRKAPEWERTFEQHLYALFAHGLAHLLNYDHQTDEEFEVMNKVEKKLLGRIDHLFFSQ